MIVSKPTFLRLLHGEHMRIRPSQRGEEVGLKMDKYGLYYLPVRTVKKILEVSKFENDLRGPTGPSSLRSVGEGFLSRLVEKAKAFGNKVVDTIRSHIAPGLQSAFVSASNALRSQTGDPRDLLKSGELHPTAIENGEIIPYRFLGPGTKIEERTNDPPVNALDALAKQHDIEYFKARNLSASGRAAAIHAADERFIQALRQHPAAYEHLPFYGLALQGIESKNAAEKLLSLFKRAPSTFYGGSLR